MRATKSFKFSVSLSKVGYESKEAVSRCLGGKNLRTYKTESLRFKQTTLTTDELIEYVSNGYAFCAVFNTNNGKKIWFDTEKGRRCINPLYKDGYMNIGVKKDEYFIGSQTVCIDIDNTKYASPKSYIKKLTFKPTFSYTSFSDNPSKRKFRLVYVMDGLLGMNEFRQVATVLHKQAEQDTNEDIKDFCGTRVSQYMNGTTRKAEITKSYNIYSIQDFQDLFESDLDKKDNTHTQTFDPELLHDLAYLSFNQVCFKYSKVYKYYYQTGIDFNEHEAFRLVDNDFVSLYFKWNGGNAVKYKDGEHRRRKLSSYAKLRRLIKPTTTPSELLFNLYVDLNRFFDNTDEAITVKTLKNKVNQAFSQTIEEIRGKYETIKKGKIKKFVINPSHYCKGMNLNQLIGAGRKEYNYSLIDKVYNTGLSIAENIEIINNAGYSFCRQTIYNYCKDRGIKINKYDDSELLELIDPDRSIRDNQGRLRDEGIRISKDRVSRLLNIIKTSSMETKQSDDVKTLDPVLSYVEVNNLTEPKLSDEIKISEHFTLPDITISFTTMEKQQEPIKSEYSPKKIDEFLDNLIKLYYPIEQEQRQEQEDTALEHLQFKDSLFTIELPTLNIAPF